MSDLTWHKVPIPGIDNTSVFPIGKLKYLKVKDTEICLVRLKKGFYALSNTCPHAGGSMAHGFCDEDHVVCPIHGFKFDAETGEMDSSKGYALNSYPTKLEGHYLFVGLEQKSWWFW